MRKIKSILFAIVIFLSDVAYISADFEKVDINDEKYKIYLPTSMEGVDDVTPFNQELYIGRKGYLKIDAKKGALKIIDEFEHE